MTWYYRLLGEGSRTIPAQRLDIEGKPVVTNESVASTAAARWQADSSYRPRNLDAYLQRNGPLTPI